MGLVRLAELDEAERDIVSAPNGHADPDRVPRIEGRKQLVDLVADGPGSGVEQLEDVLGGLAGRRPYERDLVQLLAAVGDLDDPLAVEGLRQGDLERVVSRCLSAEA
jgi:hypothetical protein